MKLVDSHCHVNDSKFDEDRDAGSGENDVRPVAQLANWGGIHSVSQTLRMDERSH